MPTEFWAVFENCHRKTSENGGRDVLDFDCIGTCPNESSAIQLQMENPEYRVRKLVTAPKRKNASGPDNH